MSSKTFDTASFPFLTTSHNPLYPPSIPTNELLPKEALEKDQIAVYVGSQPESIIVVIREKIVLGRAVENLLPDDLVDLSVYDAYKAGVSRNHAALVKKSGQLYVHDCGTINGSWLNGQRMKPYELYTICPGTVLSLGQLSLQLFFSSLSYSF